MTYTRIQYCRSYQEYAVPMGNGDYYFTADKDDAINTFIYHYGDNSPYKIICYDLAPVNKDDDYSDINWRLLL